MSYKILVADDDLDNRTIATEALQAHGYEVVQATNGLEVLEALAKHRPDLILLDLSMPKMDGWQVARQLKGMADTEDIPLIAFTAHAMKGDDRRAKESGCDDYLTKPCAPRDLVQKIKAWLPPGGPQKGDPKA